MASLNASINEPFIEPLPQGEPLCEEVLCDFEGEPVLCPERWQELKEGFDAEALQELARLFLQETPALILSLQTALEPKDPASSVALAHQLKGSSATIGAMRLSQLAHNIGEQVAQENWCNHVTLSEQLERQWAQLKGVLLCQTS